MSCKVQYHVLVTASPQVSATGSVSCVYSAVCTVQHERSVVNCTVACEMYKCTIITIMATVCCHQNDNENDNEKDDGYGNAHIHT